MEKMIAADAFLKVLNRKRRELAYTTHAVERARVRKIIGDDENRIEVSV